MTDPASSLEVSPRKGSTIAVRFGFLGWVGQFRHAPDLKLDYTDRVVIKTERGLEIGTPMSCDCTETCAKFVRPEQTDAYVRNSGEDYLARNAGEIVRVATAEDLAEQRRIDSYGKEKMVFCGQAAVRAGMEMDMIACEQLLGGERIIFYFSAEGRIDFRQMVRELAREYHTRIEMRQIGARDEARIVADLEICGRECCCKNFLKILRPVNMKMAKLQKATLDPTKVSGRCGRLRCCLRYEQENYEELDANLPDIGLRVRVEQGIGFIRERHVITQLLVLDMGEGRRVAVPLEEIQEVLGRGEIVDVPQRRGPGDGPQDNGEGGLDRRPRRGYENRSQERGPDRRPSRPLLRDSVAPPVVDPPPTEDSQPAVPEAPPQSADAPAEPPRGPASQEGRPDPRRGRSRRSGRDSRDSRRNDGDRNRPAGPGPSSPQGQEPRSDSPEPGGPQGDSQRAGGAQPPAKKDEGSGQQKGSSGRRRRRGRRPK